MFFKLKGIFLCLLPVFLLATTLDDSQKSDTNLNHSSFILDNDSSLLVPKTTGFVEKLSSELKDKTGFSLYIDILDRQSLDTKDKRLAYEKQIESSLNKPYGIIFFFLVDKKIDIVLSDDAKNMFDINDVFFSYMAPLLPEKDSDLTPERISAIILNGYSEIADRIADKYNIHLVNNFPSENLNQGAKLLLWAMLIVLVGIFIIIYFFKGKKK